MVAIIRDSNEHIAIVAMNTLSHQPFQELELPVTSVCPCLFPPHLLPPHEVNTILHSVFIFSLLSGTWSSPLNIAFLRFVYILWAAVDTECPHWRISLCVHHILSVLFSYCWAFGLLQCSYWRTGVLYTPMGDPPGSRAENGIWIVGTQNFNLARQCLAVLQNGCVSSHSTSNV